MLSTKARSRNSTSVWATAFWLDTSRAEVISSAMSSDGLRSVEMTITMRCFMPPDSSIGYRSRTSVAEADQRQPSLELLAEVGE